MSRGKSEHRDLTGNEITVGEFIVYAALWDRSATLKYGLVTRLADRDERWRGKSAKIATVRAISVDRSWDDKWELQRDGKEISLGFLDRMLVVPPEMVPEDAHTLMVVASLKAEKAGAK